MTEYTSSPEAIQEYMSSRERTAYWVQSHSPEDTQFYSPSIPPSVFNGLVPSAPPSEADSSNSTPPKMILRWNDGRPDVPIPRTHDSGAGRSRSQRQGGRSNTVPQPSHSHSRSGSHSTSSPIGRVPSQHPSARFHDRPPPTTPEEIRVLPSRPDIPQQAAYSTSQHSRSKSVPRSNTHSSSQSPPHNQNPMPQPIPLSQPGFNGHGPTPLAPLPGPRNPYNERGIVSPAYYQQQKHVAPAIVYAPAHHSQYNYAPPAIYAYPPQVGPGGVIYSHSAPQPRSSTNMGPAHRAPYPPAGAGSHLASVNERVRVVGESDSESDGGGSHRSGSTYYVIPSAGQKVHIISPDRSLYTSTSTTKSPTSPGFSLKKPFFQRLLHMADRFSSADSAKGSSRGSGRRLQRRHSTGGSSRGRGQQ